MSFATATSEFQQMAVDSEGDPEALVEVFKRGYIVGLEFAENGYEGGDLSADQMAYVQGLGAMVDEVAEEGDLLDDEIDWALRSGVTEGMRDGNPDLTSRKLIAAATVVTDIYSHEEGADEPYPTARAPEEGFGEGDWRRTLEEIRYGRLKEPGTMVFNPDDEN